MQCAGTFIRVPAVRLSVRRILRTTVSYCLPNNQESRSKNVYVLSVCGFDCDIHFFLQRDAIAMIDDTLEKRGQRHLICNQPLRLVEKVESRVTDSTKAVNRANSRALPTQPSSSRPKAASDSHYRDGVIHDNSRVVPTQPSSSRPKTASNPHYREGVKHDNSKVLPTQSSSCPKTASNPHPFIRERVGFSGVPSSSTSAKGWPNVTPVPRKRPSDTPDSAMKRQNTGKYPGCPICGGSHHLVKDCPITAGGAKRYFLLVSDFMTSFLIMS